jgi:hypothetical protein
LIFRIVCEAFNAEIAESAKKTKEYRYFCLLGDVCGLGVENVFIKCVECVDSTLLEEKDL